jgi:hypothetical protein
MIPIAVVSKLTANIARKQEESLVDEKQEGKKLYSRKQHSRSQHHSHKKQYSSRLRSRIL